MAGAFVLDTAPRSSESVSTLEARIEHRLGTLALEASFALTQPWTVLFGPSGAGKSTLLRLLAGLVIPHVAQVKLHGTTLVDTAAKVFVGAGDRGIGFVTQRPALFPHLDVAANVAFGLHRLEQEDRQRRVGEMLRLFHAEALARRMPQTLSGGEQQRVTLARALAPQPKLLLLDEPFSGLDLRLKAEILGDLLPWLREREIPALYVSHEVAEAFQTGAEVIYLRSGRVMGQGAARVVLARERDLLLESLQNSAVSAPDL